MSNQSAAIAAEDVRDRPLLEPHFQGHDGQVYQAVLIKTLTPDGKKFVPSRVDLIPLPIEKFGAYQGDRFRWGQYDAGTRLLSFNLLAGALKRPGKLVHDEAKKIAALHAIAFCDQVVSNFPDRWCITQRQIKDWLKHQQSAQRQMVRRRSIAPKDAANWVPAMSQACDHLTTYLEELGRFWGTNGRIAPEFADLLLLLQTLKSLAIARQSILDSPYWQEATCRAKTTAWVEVLKLEQGIKSAIFQFKTTFAGMPSYYCLGQDQSRRLRSLNEVVEWVSQDEYIYGKLLQPSDTADQHR